MAQSRTISSFLSLAFALGACGEEGGSGNNDDGGGPGAAAVCEEACLEADACDDTISYSPGYCEDSCTESLQQQAEIGCTSQFRSVATCRAAANTCPLPDCLAETQDYKDCVGERSLCAEGCDEASKCPGAGDFDAEACKQQCDESEAEIAAAGCVAEYNFVFLCADACDTASFETDCDEELTALTDCFFP